MKLDNIGKLEAKVEILEKRDREKDTVIKDLSQRLVNVEQYSRNCTLEIGELPITPNEKITDIVIKAAAVAKVTLLPNEIQAAHRIKARDGKTPAIIAQLTSRPKRDAMVSYKPAVFANQLLDDSPHTNKIFIRESPCPYYRNLIYQAKGWAKANNHQYVWFKGNTVFIRKSTGDPLMKIRNIEQLAQLPILTPPSNNTATTFNRNTQTNYANIDTATTNNNYTNRNEAIENHANNFSHESSQQNN